MQILAKNAYFEKKNYWQKWYY